jgi:4-hydroxy-4-methyl-2-oxoglutarate aldolase
MSVLNPEQFECLRRLDGCTLANAIEQFHERLRNEGFTNNSVHCVFPQMAPMLGYAATLKIRGSLPPTAAGPFEDRTDWWDYVVSLPEPRVVVIEDVASVPGLGSFLGPVHINILHARRCVGAVTNGAVRGVPAAQRLGFRLFAGNVTVSHSYMHVIDFGHPVKVAGLKVQSGELVHGDLHGVQSIPPAIAGNIPAAAAEIVARDEEIATLCQSKDFTLEKLRAAINRRRF